MNYLQDKQFLKQLDLYKEKEKYVKIIALGNNEYPREEIIGRATGGSINVDGTSAVRRSCSLSLVALETDTMVTDIYWCYDNKFKLEIGVKNNINKNYPEIIWFNMGVYIITSFNINKSTSNLNISISGKDKMCRLNGDISGNIAMSTDFSTVDKLSRIVQDNGNVEVITVNEKLPIKNIIENAVVEYGQELITNITVNNLEEKGYELWEYRGDEPLYLIITCDLKEIIHATTSGEVLVALNPQKEVVTTQNLYVTLIELFNQGINNINYNGQDCYIFDMGNFEGIEWYGLMNDNQGSIINDFYAEMTPEIPATFYKYNTPQTILRTKIKNINKYYSLYTLDRDYNKTASKVFYCNKLCYVIKLEYGDTAGYYQTPLVYNSDLILNVGETVTSLLDKLKNMLGDFEYFYDLNGRFVFQKKKTYQQELFSPVNGNIQLPIMYQPKYEYIFDNEELFVSVSNIPNINNIKNDFSIWGKKRTNNLPFHIRYALNKKPKKYKSYDGSTYYTEYNITDDYQNILGEGQEWGDDSFQDWGNSSANVWDDKHLEHDPGPYVVDLQAKEKITNEAVTYCYRKLQRKSNENLEYLIFITGINNTKLDENVCYYFPTPKNEKVKIQLSTTVTNTIKAKKLKFPQGRMYGNNWKYFEENNYVQELINFPNTYISFTTNTITPTIDYNKRKTLINSILPIVNWRELIYQMALDHQNYNSKSNYLINLEKYNPEFAGGKTGYEQYYSDMLGFWRLLYNPIILENDKLIQENNNYEYYTQKEIINDVIPPKWLYWNKLVHTNPNMLNFWIDFLDTSGELGKYSTYKIGTRSKAINDNAVRTLFNPQTPEILYAVLSKGDTINDLISEEYAYTPLQIPQNMEILFGKSSQSICAIERANEFINQYCLIPESINITAIPIYYLQPNTVVQIYGEDYTLDKISYNLSYNGTMSITCNKILKQI